MKERIKEFMMKKSLTAADFADKIGVQRSNISHILSGRNYPSAQFMEKIMKAFPDLSAEWLITGNGSMLKAQVANALPDDVLTTAGKPEGTAGLPLFSGMAEKGIIPGNGSRKPEKIVVFYTDKTFGFYYPES